MTFIHRLLAHTHLGGYPVYRGGSVVVVNVVVLLRNEAVDSVRVI
jgi:hypothetical protein